MPLPALKRVKLFFAMKLQGGPKEKNAAPRQNFVNISLISPPDFVSKIEMKILLGSQTCLYHSLSYKFVQDQTMCTYKGSIHKGPGANHIHLAI